MDITWTDFERIEMRIGTVLSAQEFAKARNPAYILQIDFGELGVKKSSAQITELYEVDELVGKQVVAVVNFPPKQIADLMSECLVLGAVKDDKSAVLLRPDQVVKNGLRIL